MTGKGIFDTHAHYTDLRFTTEHEGGASVLLDELFSDGVDAIINVATNSENSREVVRQAQQYRGMYAAVGIHPSDIADITVTVDEALFPIRLLLNSAVDNKIVAVGEIGLDYYWQPVDRVRQNEFFESQLYMAAEYGMPVLIHDRDAHGDVFEAILRHPNVRGVMHSYSGSAETARELVRRGWYISFSGVLTFKNAERVRSVAATIPCDRLLLETDCPYLAPEPRRGKLNRSDYIAHTAASLGTVLGMSLADTIALTNENARRLFGV